MSQGLPRSPSDALSVAHLRDRDRRTSDRRASPRSAAWSIGVDVIELKENRPTASTSSRSCPGAGRRGERHAQARPRTVTRRCRQWHQGLPVGQDRTTRRKGWRHHRVRLRREAVRRYNFTNAWAARASRSARSRPATRGPDGEGRRSPASPSSRAMSATVLGAARRSRQATRGADGLAARAEPTTLRTEYPFVLPRGYVDQRGTVHRDGVMRLATAQGRAHPAARRRVRENPAYLTVVLLAPRDHPARSVADVHAGVVENMFASDLAFLQDLYRRINQEGHTQRRGDLPALQPRVRGRHRR